MKRKGFTLIELLAVIVILAIIALIATPIILNIISDAKEESNERSVEMYASAIENAVAKYQLNNNESISGTFTSSEDGKTLTQGEKSITVDYDGSKVKCDVVEIYADGNIYLAGCNGDYTYGNKQYIQVYKPQYYSWSNACGTPPSDATTNPSELTTNTENYPFYVGFDVGSDNKITACYVCFTRNGQEYCLKRDGGDTYTTNKEVIADAFAEVLDTEACSFDDEMSYCIGADGLSAQVDFGGNVMAGYDIPYCDSCDCTSDGSW